MVTQILDKKSAGRPITSEDYHTLDRLVAQVEGNIIASRVQEHERIRKQRAMARRHVPMETWKLPLDDLDLPGRIHNLLLDNKVETVGDVLYYLELGDEVLMGFKGFGLKMLETMREVADRYMVALQRRLALEGVGEGTAVVAPMTVESVPPVPEVVAEVVVAPPVVEAVAEPETAVETVEVVEMVAAPVIEEVAAPELVVEPVSEVVAEPEPDPEPEPEPIPEPVLPAPPEAEPVVVSEIDDLSRSLVEEAQAASAAEPVVKPPVVVPRTAPKVETPEEIASRQRGKKGRQLVFNEEIGEVVTQRKRKGSRRQQPWEDYDMDDNY